MNLKTILVSGHSFDVSEHELKLRFILFNSLLIFNILIVTLATFVRFSHAQYIHASIDAVYVLLASSSFILARYEKKNFDKLVYFVIFFSYSVVTLSFYGGLNPLTGIGWYFILLMITFFLKGHREGGVIFVISLFTIISISYFKYLFTPIEIFLGLIPFLGSLFFMYFFENINNKLKNIIEEQKEFYQYQAQYDGLTKIPNRALFLDRLSQSIKTAKRSKTKLAILFIDLDHFKEINDSLGHHIGDRVLIEVAKRLNSQIRESDTVARIGGDEFSIIIDGFSDIKVVNNIIEKLFDSMSYAYQCHEHHLKFSLSLGVTVFPEDSENMDTLLQNADKAMYRAKNSGRNTYHFYNQVV